MKKVTSGPGRCKVHAEKNCNSFSFTCSLFSFLFTITAVICWSMKIKMVAKMAGRTLRMINHQGFLSLSGLMSQERPGRVG